MTRQEAARVVLGALILSGCLALAARAEDAPKAEPAPVAEPGTTAQSNCLTQNSGWTREGRGIGFTIELVNKCEQRLKCRVFAYVTSAKGAAQGRGTLVLAPAAKGAAATKHWSMPVKMSGGSAQSARECRVF
jgi:hypothetical protein